jgi:ferrous iron transport protein B
MLIGTGCGVPAVMASRTIENERDRRMTITTTTFIPCSAKLPIIAMISGALFGGAWWVAPSAYFVGIAAIIASGIILKKTKRFAGDPAPFVMELPNYHVPGVKSVLIHMWDRAKSFVKKAGTIIFLACGLIWFLSSFNWGMEMVDTTESMLADIGNVIAPIFKPLGFGDWQASVATITGLVAKENVVGTFGILYGFAEVAEDGMEFWASLQASFTPIAAYAFLVFNLLCAPCFAAIGAIKREMGSAKWTLFAVGYQTIFAYAIALCVNQLGLLFTGGSFTLWSVIAILIVAAMLVLLFRPYKEYTHEPAANQPLGGI